jgi:hypothetical protein
MSSPIESCVISSQMNVFHQMWGQLVTVHVVLQILILDGYFLHEGCHLAALSFLV